MQGIAIVEFNEVAAAMSLKLYEKLEQGGVKMVNLDFGTVAADLATVIGGGSTRVKRVEDAIANYKKLRLADPAQDWDGAKIKFTRKKKKGR